MAECGAKEEKSHGTLDTECYNKPSSICTVKCHASVVRKMALKMDLKTVTEDQPWDIFWSDKPVCVQVAQRMKSQQKLNRFFGTDEITRKDYLAKNLNKFSEKYPFDYNFCQRTWCLPEDFDKLKSYSEANHNITYIVKPRAGSGGRGIYLTKNISDIKKQEGNICQMYLSKPLLIEKFKFDIRVYVLITSCEPLSIFVYRDGLIRLATVKYENPTPLNVSNQYMHLTNFSVNKSSPTFDKHSKTGSKRNFSFFNTWLENKNHDVSNLWSQVDDVIVKTIISGIKEVKKSYKEIFVSHSDHSASFQLLGFDIILDRNLKPYLLEVNGSPSLHTGTKVDREVKESLISDTLKLLYFGKKEGAFKESDFFEYEDSNLGNFRRVYPGRDSLWYDALFLSSSVPTSVDEHELEQQVTTDVVDEVKSLSLSVDKPLSPPSEKFVKRKEMEEKYASLQNKLKLCSAKMKEESQQMSRYLRYTQKMTKRNQSEKENMNTDV